MLHIICSAPLLLTLHFLQLLQIYVQFYHEKYLGGIEWLFLLIVIGIIICIISEVHNGKVRMKIFWASILIKVFTFLFQDKGQPLPKFGEWDVNDPASAEGFTVIFNKARDEKKTGGNPESPGKVDSQSKPAVDVGKPQAVRCQITSLFFPFPSLSTSGYIPEVLLDFALDEYQFD
ncbi:hypothetical protein I3760_12G135900 [Carya illinoinensis]|nr:hypothetical protein I3760_12G135900 [Carya illinoinensis]